MAPMAPDGADAPDAADGPGDGGEGRRLHVVVGVGGGIAAYKACHLIRFLAERGHDVRVTPTPAALEFVGAATFEALSGNSASVSVFDAVDEVRHVRVGQDADLVVVAPATADLMARAAHGRADDLLTATLLVATCPVVFAPAMHTEMWNHPATRDNVAALRRHGAIVLDPASGRLTGPDSGPGRLPEPEEIGALALLAAERPGSLPRDLEGRRVVVTSGGTHEAIDPVRFIGNRSSGRQGRALAEVASRRGARVTLVVGAVEDPSAPAGVEVRRVTSARDMEAAVMEESADADALIMAAAVADFRPASEAGSKMKKGDADDALRRIDLVENPDILASAVDGRCTGGMPAGAVIVGFAAETGDATATPLEHAIAKIARKGCDLMMCNDVSPGGAFGSADNEGWLLDADGGVEEIPRGSKHAVAATILDRVSAVLRARG